MDHVGLPNMGLNQIKRNIRHISAQRGAYLKIKEKKTRCNSRKFLPSPELQALLITAYHNVGLWGYIKILEGAAGTKGP